MSYRLFLIVLSFLFVQYLNASHSKAQPKSFPRLNRHNQQQKAALASNAIYQLEISKPGTQFPLIANTTYEVLITAFPIVAMNKAFNADPVQIRTTFDCAGIKKAFVFSLLDIQSTFVMDPELRGICIMFAEALNNPNYAPSVPVQITIETPLYYEGTLDNVLHTGEAIDIMVRPSDNSKVPVTFNIKCSSGSQVSFEIITTVNMPYVLPPQLTGDCTFTTPVVPQYYIPIDPVNVIIEPSIVFIEPTQGQVYPTGSTITAKLSSTNGGNPIVTVDLTCEGKLAASQTKALKSVFTFLPSTKIYGNCILSVDTMDAYYTGNTVDIIVENTLTFKLPKKGETILTGKPYTIQVDGSAGNGIVKAIVETNCEVGGTFTHIVTLGEASEFIMGAEFGGKCIMTATAEVPYFTKAVTTITVFQTLNPSEVSRVAKSLALNGRIFSKTRHNLNRGGL